MAPTKRMLAGEGGGADEGDIPGDTCNGRAHTL